MKLPIFALAVVTAGAMMGQAPAPQQPNSAQSPAGVHRNARGHKRGMLQRLTMRLNLTPDQQERVKGILKESRDHNKALAANVRVEHQSLASAVRSDSEQQIDQITQQNARLNSQMEAMHLKQMAKIYAILTPDQKAKFDQRSTAHSRS